MGLKWETSAIIPSGFFPWVQFIPLLWHLINGFRGKTQCFNWTWLFWSIFFCLAWMILFKYSSWQKFFICLDIVPDAYSVLFCYCSSWYQWHRLNFIEMIHGLGGGFLDWICFGFCLRIITSEKKKKRLWLVGILQVASATIKLHSL